MPPSPSKRCSECGRSLAGRSIQTITCSSNCRAARTRRKQRALYDKRARLRESGAATPGGVAMRELIDGSLPDVAKDVMREELAPVVREALTEDVLRAISGLVGLTPMAVEALQQDIMGMPILDDDGNPLLNERGEVRLEINPERRHKAVALLLRYTVGHGAIIQQEEPNAQGITVVFPGMPRPDSALAPVPPPSSGDSNAPAEVESTAVETLICNVCGVEKPRSEFVGQSDRCAPCHSTLVLKREMLESELM